MKLLTPERMHGKGLRSLELSAEQRMGATCGQGEHRLNIASMEFAYPGSAHGVRLRDQCFCGGQVIAVIGRNGAGKSTFLRCLSGLEKHVKAELEFDGQKLSARKMLCHTAMVMQDVNHQLFSDSVRKELLYELERRKWPKARRESEVDHWLERIQLLEAGERHPMAISGGQKQRLAIAAAALSDKELILFDEPTSGLDYVHMKQVSELIGELAGQGKIIFIVSHDPDLLLRVCNEVMVMEEGTVQERYPLSAETAGALIRWFRSLYNAEHD